MSRSAGPAPGTVPVVGLHLRQPTAADWDAIARVQNAARLADGLDEIQSGETLAGEHPESERFQVERDGLVAEVAGRIVAFAFGNRVERGGILVGESWGAVHPEVRRRGIGTLLARTVRARLAADLAADPQPGPRELRSYAMDQEPGTVALLAAEGYVPIRYGFEMRRPLTGPLPAFPLPHGLEVRPATEDRYRAIFDADEEAFLDHWGHRTMDEADFQVRCYGPEADPSLWVVAWDGDQVAGVVMNAIYHEENAVIGVRRGWLDHVSVRRPWRGRGLAKALCARSFAVLRDQGMDEAWLGVDAKNPTGALALYEHLGFTVTRRWQAFGRPVDGPATADWASASA